jgi:Tfp pilus assembly protein PilN
MSNAVKTRSKLRPAPVEKVARPVRGSDTISIGSSPRVSLLPPEVHARGRARAVRRRIVFALIGVIALVAVAAGLATVSLLGAQSGLTNAQNTASSLAGQQAKFGIVTQVQSDITAIKAAQISVMQPEVEWRPYIKALEGTLSGGMTITGVQASLDLATSTPVAAIPLQGPHIATLKVTVTSPQNSISAWLDKLPSLKGFVDATPGSVTQASGSYTVNVTIHISDAALAKRFTPAKATK